MPPLSGALRHVLPLAAPLMLIGSPAAAGGSDLSAALDAHRELAVRHPEQFGFASAEEARGATPGWSYPYFSLPEWAALPREPDGSVDLGAHPAPRRLTEILAPDGTPRCVLIQGRSDDGGWGPGVLGFANLRDGLQALSRRPRRGALVFLVDPESRRLRVADRNEPDEILEVEP